MKTVVASAVSAFKRLISNKAGPDDLDTARQALAEVDTVLEKVQEQLTATEKRSEELVSAIAAGDDKLAREIEANLRDLRARVASIKTARQSVAARVLRAEAAARAALEAEQRVNLPRMHAEARRDALVRLEAALDQVTAALPAVEKHSLAFLHACRESGAGLPDSDLALPGLSRGSLQMLLEFYLAKRAPELFVPKPHATHDTIQSAQTPVQAHDAAVGKILGIAQASLVPASTDDGGFDNAA